MQFVQDHTPLLEGLILGLPVEVPEPWPLFCPCGSCAGTVIALLLSIKTLLPNPFQGTARSIVDKRNFVNPYKTLPFTASFLIIITRGRAVVARRAHNPKVVGASPTPATLDKVSCK